MSDSGKLDRRVAGKITHDQIKTSIEHFFEVSNRTTRIAIDFDYSPKRPEGSDLAHEISLSLYDPTEGRGARHNNPDQRIILTDGYASKGYVPGSLVPGTWVVSIDVHRIIETGEVDYWLTIHTDTAPQPAPSPPFASRACAPRGSGWYRGDLHGHTLHSDAEWDVPDFAAYARKIGLDFVTLTDHNTVSGVAECLSLAHHDLLVMGGIELTTFWGHCLVVGNNGWVDWRTSGSRTMSAVASEQLAKGALFVIAHPMHIGDPWCSGCDWRYSDTMPGRAQAVEVWNGDWSGMARNEVALDLYYTWLNLGHRLVATAGSDTHGPFTQATRPGYNVVYSESLSRDGILEAVLRGSLYLSSGPELQFSAVTDGETAMMGGCLKDSAATLSISWDGCPPDASVRIARRPWGREGTNDAYEIGRGEQGTCGFELEARSPSDWAVIEVRDGTGALHAVTNPIFFGNWDRKPHELAKQPSQ